MSYVSKERLNIILQSVFSLDKLKKKTIDK